VAKVRVRHGELIAEVEIIADRWALRSQLEIPLSHVAGASLARSHAASEASTGLDPLSPFHALGASSFVEVDGILMWDVADPARAITINLADETYPDIMVEVDDPEAVVDRINAAVIAYQV
jgi:hypothetical protein